MTALAAATKAAVVGIVLLMATVAIAGDTGMLGKRGTVATVATQVFMGTVKCEVGLPVMIEAPQRPGIRGVTEGAIRSQ